MTNWRERISVNPAICHGKACIRGRRVTVSAIVDSVAAVGNRAEILASYPLLRGADVDAKLAYAARTDA